MCKCKCKCKCFNAIAIFISILLGIGFTILAYFGIVGPFCLGVKIALIIAVLVIGAVVFAATSLLRQDHKVDACVCSRALNALVAALLSIIIGAFALLYTGISLVVFFSLVFILATLFVYSLLAVGCLYACIICAGCHHHHSCGCDD